jgi:Rieske Fe-S protein
MKINRLTVTRRAVNLGFVLTALGSRLLQNTGRAQSVLPVRITELEKLKSVWDDAEFRFANQVCVLVRVPVPRTPNPRVLNLTQDKEQITLIAYSRVCTHLGCTTTLPNGLRMLNCGCHGSEFDASNGNVVAGPASAPLRAVKLEVREGAVFAVGWLDS